MNGIPGGGGLGVSGHPRNANESRSDVCRFSLGRQVDYDGCKYLLSRACMICHQFMYGSLFINQAAISFLFLGRCKWCNVRVVKLKCVFCDLN